MKSTLIKILDELTQQADRAEFFAGSENETTADRYSHVEYALGDAILAIESAIDALSDR